MGDLDYDFFGLLADTGEVFTRQVLAHYGHADPDRAVRKSRFFAGFDAVVTWLAALEEDCDWKLVDGRTRLHRALAAAEGRM